MIVVLGEESWRARLRFMQALCMLVLREMGLASCASLCSFVQMYVPLDLHITRRRRSVGVMGQTSSLFCEPKSKSLLLIGIVHVAWSFFALAFFFFPFFSSSSSIRITTPHPPIDKTKTPDYKSHGLDRGYNSPLDQVIMPGVS